MNAILIVVQCPRMIMGLFFLLPPLFTMGAPFLSLSDSRGREEKGRAEGKGRRRRHRSLFFRHRPKEEEKRGIRCPLWCHFGGRGGRGLDLRGVVEKREGKDVIPPSLSSHAMGRRNIRGIAYSSFPLSCCLTHLFPSHLPGGEGGGHFHDGKTG